MSASDMSVSGIGDEDLAGIQVLGSNLSNVLNAFGTFQLLASRIMVEEGLGKENKEGALEFDPNTWYPVTRWLAALRRVGREFGDNMLLQVGLAVPKNAIFPPFVIDIETALNSIDVAYHMNHSVNGEPMFSPTKGEMREGIGHYAFSRNPREKRIELDCNNPYPCTFDQGLILAMAQRFEPSATLAHDTTLPCRKDGGPSCKYVIAWK